MSFVAEGHAARNGVARLETVTKRDGRKVPFDQGKIVSAVRRCCTNGTRTTEGRAQELAEQIARSVVNVLRHADGQPDVEHIQRIVIQQLWAAGLFTEAEHYQNYREERRRAREEQPIAERFRRAVEEDAAHFPTPLGYFQFLDKYARWNEAEFRRETWRECCGRVLGFFRKQPQLAAVTEEEWQLLEDAMYRHRASPAMRVVQMAGPSLDRCQSGAFNCCYVACDDLQAFVETLYLLMQGCGVGYSVESEYVDKLPRVRKQKGGPARRWVIADSTEGWCDAFREGLHAWVSGEDIDYDYSLIRPYGARLKTKGGRASGPEPLRQLLTFARKVILNRQGRRLTPRDCHDILCVTGKIVQVGGVRRASEISLSDLDDTEMRDAKKGDWYNQSPWLDMANNSAVYEEKPDAVTFMEEWLALARSGSGERGIFNRGGLTRQVPKRRKRAKFGLNPCGEVILRSGQMCNLSIAVARVGDTPETLEEKVILATIFGTLQSTLTDFRYLRDLWKRNCDEERLLGVDITGQMDCPLLRPGAPGREQLLDRLKAAVLRTNEEWAARLGIPASAAATVVKPSGNSAWFFDCSSGMHTRWSRHQVRRVRVNRYGPMALFLQAEGVPHAIDPMNDTLLVFDFLPDPAPEGTPTRNDLTAVEQFHNWLVWKEHWTEHNPSATIYVGPDEWLALGHEVYKHFDQVGGLTFLPRDSGTYKLAPNEELTREEYEARRAVFPDIKWAKLSRYEKEDTTAPRAESACAGGACEL
jgi:ribonucleoside-diphosphate reductase alpha chain